MSALDPNRIIPRTGVSFADFEKFVTTTVNGWMDGGLIKAESWGLVLRINAVRGLELEKSHSFIVKSDRGLDPRYDGDWYVGNAEGKLTACFAAGMDSHEVLGTWEGLLVDVPGAFPWGGGVIDTTYELAVGFSGANELEDILVARTVRNWIVMHIDTLGRELRDAARKRGQKEPNGTKPVDRFTRHADSENM